MKDLKKKFNSLFRQREGDLTRDLVQKPAKYGLGKLPVRLHPDKTTTMVCGFCSVGCGLKIHIKDDQAVNLTPNTRHPVNLG